MSKYEEYDQKILKEYVGKQPIKLNEFIAFERVKKGISTKQVASRINYLEEEYIKMEKAEIPIKKEVLNEIINFLKLPKKIKKLAYDSNKPMYAKRLAELRFESGLTMEQESVVLGLNIKTYSNYENGTREIPFEILIRIADAYNISLDYLLGRTNIREDFNKRKEND